MEAVFFMSKTFYLSQRNEIWYVRFFNPLSNSLTTAKSTGTKDKTKAEQIAMTWFVTGNIPKDIRSCKNTKQLQKSNIIQGLKSCEYDKNYVKEVIEIFKQRGFIESVIFKNDPNSITFIKYLYDFWDYDNSSYVKEKLISKHQIHRSHCEDCQRVSQQQYKDYFNNRLLGTITLNDMKNFRNWLVDKGLSASRVNNILRAGSTALKYAFYNGLTYNNCFQGLVFCGKKDQKKRDILTIEEAEKVFQFNWSDYQAKLANKIAFVTGMRLSEIRALKLSNIGSDRIYVNNNYNKREGLKCCKNGDIRQVFIPSELSNEIIQYGLTSPFLINGDGFVFYGLLKDKPIDTKTWTEEFKSVKKQLGINKPDVTFHSWRHLFITIMSGSVTSKKLQQVTGHKTEEMIELYSNHQQESVFKELSKEVENLIVSHL
jgi:integrase